MSQSKSSPASITKDLLARCGKGNSTLIQPDYTVTYSPGINRMTVDFASDHQKDQELVYSRHIPNAVVPAWAETAMDIFSRYHTIKEEQNG